MHGTFENGRGKRFVVVSLDAIFLAQAVLTEKSVAAIRANNAGKGWNGQLTQRLVIDMRFLVSPAPNLIARTTVISL
jgi:hypothetical protein